jgi:hypothetical protein
MAAAMDYEERTEQKIADFMRVTKDPSCKNCLDMEARLRETLEELSSAKLITELLRNEVSVGSELTGKQCVGGIVNMQNTKGEPLQKLHIKEKWSDVVAGRSISRRNEDSTSEQNLESNITSRTTEEQWNIVRRVYKKNPCSINHASNYQIPVIINRYELLRNRGNYEEKVYDSRSAHELEIRNEGRDKVQEKN